MRSDIKKLVSGGFYREALSLYSQLKSSSFRPDSFTFASLLKACGKLKATSEGREIHARVFKTGFHTDVYAATALISMYIKFHLLEDALKLFNKIAQRNIALFNATISGFSQHGNSKEALWAFQQVCARGFQPNSVTIASVLPACERLDHGLQVHGFAVKLGVERDVYVATAIVTMYWNCQELISATRVFKLIPDKNVVSYNSLISGLLQNGLTRMALNVFKEMRESSRVEASTVTWVSVLSASSSLLDARLGRQVHGLILKHNISSDVMVGTTLADMYAKCRCWNSAYEIFKELGENRNLVAWNSMISGTMLNGQYETAVELFEQLILDGLEPDSTTWNSMISGFSQLGKAEEAFRFFTRMQLEGVAPSLKSITSLLPACSALSALLRGKEIHGHIIRTGFIDDEFICTALIDMYMKCGYSSWAFRIFYCAQTTKDPAIWNAMISGYGRNGEYKSAFEIFSRMEEERVQPNLATFAGLLSACAHSGLIDEAWKLFRLMSTVYGLIPTTVHFCCMVDLLGRAGRLNEARDLIQEIPEPSVSVFASLLGACTCNLDANLGEEMAEKLSESDPGNPTPYVLLSNIYAGQGRWMGVERIREMIKERGLRKVAGCSLIREAQETRFT
ncbi:PREDICTED: pentatricopeptide repeat-containing protein At2g02750 [Nelumbo nucifera]|uniref:Pentatricopeptide repeat-containing protein At2g02750 n=2 Tax=Nelumbo nucifera TaxID=4432 RepID=A0A1U7ZQV2_NELNU|nr:PREDICTED: pentatricopeptide repeat-containing protein At2g02750 [Nelumbo nucifera]DAD34806.1 TPA_asm: hypothetical protein HUJ06_005446 [Nelumbo nucifera]